MNRTKLFSAIITVMLGTGAAYAFPSQLQFTNYSATDGLPDDNVNVFAQDKFGFVWAGTKDGIARYEGGRFYTPSFISTDCPLDESISSLCVDAQNVLWACRNDFVVKVDLNAGSWEIVPETRGRSSHVVCEGFGESVWLYGNNTLMCYSTANGEFTSYDTKENFNPQRACQSSDGSVWFTCSDGYIYHHVPDGEGFSRIKVLSDEELAASVSLRRITSVDDHIFIVSTNDNSVFRVNTNSGRVRKIFDGIQDGKDAIVLDLLVHDSEEFWIATDNGLFIIRLGSHEISRYEHTPSNPHSLAGTNLRCLFKDSDGRIWVGTFYKGASCYVQMDSDFYTSIPEDPEHSLTGQTVRSICSDPQGDIWIATEDGYLEHITADGKVLSFGGGNRFSANLNFQSVICVGGLLYVGSYGSGVYVFDPQNEKVLKRYDAGFNNVSCLLGTADGDVFAGTSDSLYKLDKEADRFAKVESVGNGFAHALAQDSDGRIWVGFFRRGLTILSPKTMQAVRPQFKDPGVDISRLRITHINEDNLGRMWLSTESDGLYVIGTQPDEQGFYSVNRFDKNSGLPSNIVCASTQGKDGNIWASTLKGIAKIGIDGTVKDIVEYPAIGNYYRYGSVYNSPGGLIYMGTVDGMVAFNPNRTTANRHRLCIADVVCLDGDKYVPVAEDGHSATTSRRISLRASEASSLTIRTASLGSDLSESVRYRYTLSRKGKKSQAVTQSNTVTYANLTQGIYNFKASVVGDSSPDATVDIDLKIIPPIYACVAAKILYVLLALAVISALIVLARANVRKENARREESLEAEKQKEIFESRVDFFTHVSHEIRTPLTLIKVPIDRILGKKLYTPESKDDIMVIKSNADRLFELTDKILDMRKMESGQMHPNFLPVNFNNFVRKTAESFEALAAENGIEYNVDVPEGSKIVMCAQSSIEKILSNLIVNGIKYCKSKVSVSLIQKDDDTVSIMVGSDGEPLPADERERIFEPFYQSRTTRSNLSVAKGAGLGLSLARSLASMHNGTLVLDPAYTEGNMFVLTIPVRQEDGIMPTETDKKDKENDDEATNLPEEDSEKHTVLVVEDDKEMREYICKELSDEYAVLQADNGAKALEILSDKPVSLIVSDIMMPEMDGCQLCDTVKNTIEYSHIPVILLTAMAGYDTHLKTLRSGADAYITKPFSMELLKATIFNQFKNREILYQQFATAPFSHQVVQQAGSKDDDFMNRLYEVVMENISDVDMSVFGLADMMHTSRSTLFRKVKANTGQNVNDYIRICRLKKAAELLSSNKYMIKEVSYMVGYTSPSYFAKQFQEQFGISPSAVTSKK